MHFPLRRRHTLAALAAVTLAPLAHAQTFTPGQPIKVMIGVPAGGTQDALTRAIAHEVRALGPLVVDNRSSAAGRIAIATVKTAAPDTVGGALPLQVTGRVKVLATSGDKRSPLMPSLPTFVEAGYKDVVAAAWFAYYAPRNTPQPIVDKLRAEFTRAVNAREVRQQLLQNGMYPVGDGPEALLKTMREDTARWGGIMRAVNFTAND